jgi:hypothetical protein
MGAGVQFLGNEVAVALLVEVDLLGGRADFLRLARFGTEQDLDLIDKTTFEEGAHRGGFPSVIVSRPRRLRW